MRCTPTRADQVDGSVVAQLELTRSNARNCPTVRLGLTKKRMGGPGGSRRKNEERRWKKNEVTKRKKVKEEKQCHNIRSVRAHLKRFNEYCCLQVLSCLFVRRRPTLDRQAHVKTAVVRSSFADLPTTCWLANRSASSRHCDARGWIHQRVQKAKSDATTATWRQGNGVSRPASASDSNYCRSVEWDSFIRSASPVAHPDSHRQQEVFIIARRSNLSIARKWRFGFPCGWTLWRLDVISSGRKTSASRRCTCRAVPSDERDQPELVWLASSLLARYTDRLKTAGNSVGRLDNRRHNVGRRRCDRSERTRSTAVFMQFFSLSLSLSLSFQFSVSFSNSDTQVGRLFLQTMATAAKVAPRSVFLFLSSCFLFFSSGRTNDPDAVAMATLSHRALVSHFLSGVVSFVGPNATVVVFQWSNRPETAPRTFYLIGRQRWTEKKCPFRRPRHEPDSTIVLVISRMTPLDALNLFLFLALFIQSDFTSTTMECPSVSETDGPIFARYTAFRRWIQFDYSITSRSTFLASSITRNGLWIGRKSSNPEKKRGRVRTNRCGTVLNRFTLFLPIRWCQTNCND